MWNIYGTKRHEGLKSIRCQKNRKSEFDVFINFDIDTIYLKKNQEINNHKVKKMSFWVVGMDSFAIIQKI
jgi:hypothetical protein